MLTRCCVQIVDFCQNFANLKEMFSTKPDHLLAAALWNTDGEDNQMTLAADSLM
jgi:hypothetical protein